MAPAFDPFQEAGDVIDPEAVSKAEIVRLNPEWRCRRAAARLEAGAQGVVDDDAHRAARASHLAIDAHGDIVVQGEGRPRAHILKSSHRVIMMSKELMVESDRLGA